MSHNTDALTPRGTHFVRRIPPPVIVASDIDHADNHLGGPRPPTMPPRASSFKKKKPPDGDASSSSLTDNNNNNNNSSSSSSSNTNNNNDDASSKKSIRFAEAQSSQHKRGRRGSRCTQQALSWERMLNEQKSQLGGGSGNGLVLIPFFDGSFHTVWAPSPAAPSGATQHQDDASANGDYCECRCRLPLTARLWAASKWYRCFMPAVLCMPVAVGSDMIAACCCCCCAAPPKDPTSSSSSSSACSTPSVLPPHNNFMTSP